MLAALLLIALAVVGLTVWRLQASDDASPRWSRSYRYTFDSGNDLEGWTVYDKAAPNSAPTTGWWNANHVFVRGGKLVFAGYLGNTTSGQQRIVTGGAGTYQHPQTYGKWTARVRIQPCAQVKYVLLLWPVSGNWPHDGEIDFAEDLGGDRKQVRGSVVFPSSNPEQKAAGQTQYVDPAGGMTRWHTVGVEWTPKTIRYTLDGHYWGKPVTQHVPHSRMAFAMQTEGLVPPSGELRCDAELDSLTQYSYRG